MVPPPLRAVTPIVLVALLPTVASAQSRRSLEASPRDGSQITIDGRLDEQAWAGAEIGDGFTERSPTPEATPPVDTHVRVLYDEDALYVGVTMQLLVGETPRALELRRDSFRIYNDDAVTLKIDVARDRRTSTLR